MRYFLDTEFFERPGRIDLISVGVVADDDREYYAEDVDFDWTFAELRGLEKSLRGLAGAEDPRLETPRWLLENVKPHLTGSRRWPGHFGSAMAVETIRSDLLSFFAGDTEPSFWGLMCDYDWVVFCWIFGRMADKPESFPYYCNDLAQYMDMVGVERSELPPAGEHNALTDARWNKQAFQRIRELSADRAFAMPPRADLGLLEKEHQR